MIQPSQLLDQPGVVRIEFSTGFHQERPEKLLQLDVALVEGVWILVVQPKHVLAALLQLAVGLFLLFAALAGFLRKSNFLPIIFLVPGRVILAISDMRTTLGFFGPRIRSRSVLRISLL